jgi:putrescine---pyruvate transaminase
MANTIKKELTIKELQELDKKHFLHPTSSIKQQQEQGPAFIFTEGQGIYLKDIHGDTIIDGLSSLWNVNVGHGREELGQVAMEQMTKLGFSSSFMTFSHEPAIRLATKLAELTPGDLNTIFFTSGGSESNDTAFKLIRHYWMLKGKPEKKKILSRKRSYHGVAMGATSATGLDAFRHFTNSLAPDFYHVDNDSIESLKNVIEKEGPETIAAFISEPVQGTGGVLPPLENYFKEIRKICDQYEILFIADEVITGFGRTGKYFGIEHYGVIPDLMSFAKGVTSGYVPLGGVIISEKIHQDLIELSNGILFHGYTYSAHPTACAVALRNLEIIERENLVENARVMGQTLLEGFQWLQKEHDLVGEVRTLGLLGAIELVKDKVTQEKFKDPIAPKAVAEIMKCGLVCRGVTYEGSDTLVFAPPLVINQQEVNQIIDILDTALLNVKKELGK